MVLAAFMTISLCTSNIAFAIAAGSLIVTVNDTTGEVTVTGATTGSTLYYAVDEDDTSITALDTDSDTNAVEAAGLTDTKVTPTEADNGKVVLVVAVKDDKVTEKGASSVIDIKASDDINNSDDIKDPDDTEEPDIDPVAPKLPTINLKNIHTIINKPANINIGAVGSGVTRKYAVVSHGSPMAASDWKDYTGTLTLAEGDWDVTYKVVNTTEDALETMSDTYRVVVDTTIPVLETPSVTKNASTKTITLTLSATDVGTGIDKIEYSVNSSAWQTYTAPIAFTANGVYEVQYHAIDKAGNTSANQSYTVTHSTLILMAIPTVRMLDDSPNNEYIRFRLQDFNIELFDYSYQFVEKNERVDRSGWEYCSGATYMEIDEEGEWDLYIMVEYDDYSDYAKVATCVIDQTEPDIVKVIQPKANSKVNFNITVDARDDLSRNLEYSFDGGKTWGSSDSKTYRKATVILPGDIQVRDEAGNVAESGFCGIVEMDGRKTVFTEDPDSVDSNIVDRTPDKDQDNNTDNTGNNGNNNTDNTGNTTPSSAYTLKSGMTVNYDAKNRGYVGGYEDGTFKPDNSITRAELATILNRVFDFTSYSNQEYMDVKGNHWAYSSIAAIQSLNMFALNGNWFLPDAVVTRAELAHAICQFVDTSKVNIGSNPYNDISISNYYNDIMAVSQLGIMNGVGGSQFSPNTVLTRAQVVTVINRLIGISSSAMNVSKSFSDVSTSHWGYNDIMLASR